MIKVEVVTDDQLAQAIAGMEKLGFQKKFELVLLPVSQIKTLCGETQLLLYSTEKKYYYTLESHPSSRREVPGTYFFRDKRL